MEDHQRDPVELRKAVDETAQLARVLTFTFLSVWLYLIVTAAATTHRDLLVGRDVQLPILGVGVPLYMFYALAPLLFLVLHGNLLLHLQTLARRIAAFDAALDRLPAAERAHQMSLLAPFPFVEWLARRGSRGFVASVYGGINLLLYVLLPLAGLVLLQLRFLPFQSDLITGWHVLCVVADLVLVWIVWPTILRPGRSPLAAVRSVLHEPGRRRAGLFAACGLSLLFVGGAAALWLDAHTTYLFSALQLRDQVLVAAEPGRDSIVAYQEKMQDQRLGEARAHLELGRPLDLTERNLRSADLRGAKLFGARLAGADLSGAQLGRARLDGARLRGAVLDGAALIYADLTAADLTDTSLRGADLAFARLRNTDLTGAVFDGADLWGAELMLSYVCAPQDLDLRRRDDEGPCPSPRFVASKLNGAVLIGVSMAKTDLTGADLRYAQLQGADLRDAIVDGAFMEGANVWRGRIASGETLTRTVRNTLSEQPMSPDEAARLLSDACRIARPDRFGTIRQNLIRIARSTIADVPDSCAERFGQVDPEEPEPPAAVLADATTAQPTQADSDGTLAGLLASLACDDAWRMQGVVRRLRDDWPGGRSGGLVPAPASALAQRCEDPTHCGYVAETARRIVDGCSPALQALPPIDRDLVSTLATR